MPQYESAGFQPPAPVMSARVQGPTNVIAPDVPLLIDTGADVSIIPLAAAKAVGANIQPSAVSIQFYTGTGTALQEAELTVIFSRFRSRGSFLVAETDYGIVGRNILNRLVLTLDGPNQTWTLGT